MQPLQEKYGIHIIIYDTHPLHSAAEHDSCFGCGTQNKEGLQIKSFVENDRVVSRFTPHLKHHAFGNILNGGIAGVFLDCSSNHCAAFNIMEERKKDGGDEEYPCTVTAEYSVKLLKPTHITDKNLEVVSTAVKCTPKMAKIHSELFEFDEEQERVCTATCDGVFVAVKPGHPAYHRWGE